MKALTLTQPWATLVAIGAKRIETRSWSTTYRGPLAIHAAKGLGPVGGKKGLGELCSREPFCSVLNYWGKRHYAEHPGLEAMARNPFMPLGAIVATCTLVDVCPIVTPRHMGDPNYTSRGMYLEILPDGRGSRDHDVTGNEFAFGDYTPGRYAWLLTDIKPLPEPIPAKGALGLWEWQGAPRGE